MTKDVAIQRQNGKVTYCGCMSMKQKTDIMPKNYDSPMDRPTSVNGARPTKKSILGKNMSVNIEIELAELSGFMFGTTSTTFRQVKKKYPAIG